MFFFWVFNGIYVLFPIFHGIFFFLMGILNGLQHFQPSKKSGSMLSYLQSSMLLNHHICMWCIHVYIYIYIHTAHTHVERQRERCRNFKPMWNPMEIWRRVETHGIPLMNPQSTGIYDDLWRFMDVHALKHGMIDRFPPIPYWRCCKLANLNLSSPKKYHEIPWISWHNITTHHDISWNTKTCGVHWTTLNDWTFLSLSLKVKNPKTTRNPVETYYDNLWHITCSNMFNRNSFRVGHGFLGPRVRPWRDISMVEPAERTKNSISCGAQKPSAKPILNLFNYLYHVDVILLIQESRPWFLIHFQQIKASGHRWT